VPELPQIFARTRPAELQLPRPPDSASGFFEKIAQVSAHIQEGMETAQTARLRGEGAATIVDAINNARINNADPEEYKRQATEAVKEAHQSILDQASTGNVRLRVQSALADDMIRAQTHIATQYQQKKIDQAHGDNEQLFRNTLTRYGDADSQAERDRIEHEYGQATLDMVKGGLMTAAKGQEKMIAWKKQSVINHADSLIRTGNFGAYYNEANKGAFKDLTQAEQLTLDNRVDAAIKRQFTLSKDLKKAQIDDAVDDVASRIEAGERPDAVWKDLSENLKQRGLFGVEARGRFNQLVNDFKSTKGEDSEQYYTILDRFEQDRSRFPNGMPDRATIVKHQREVDAADLDIKSKEKLRDHFNDWNYKRAQFDQSQATHAEVAADRQERRSAKAKQDAIKRGEIYLQEAVVPPSIAAKLRADPTGKTLTYSEQQILSKENGRFSILNRSIKAEADASDDAFGVYKKRADEIKGANIKVDEAKQKQDKINKLSPKGKEVWNYLNPPPAQGQTQQPPPK
jgi:hypothetical protein